MAQGDGLPIEWAARKVGLHPHYSIYGDTPQPRPARAQATRRPQPRPRDLTAELKAEIALYGHDGYPQLCALVHEDWDTTGPRQLLDPPAPYRGHLRLLFAADPNPGPDGQHDHVLLVVPGHARTCHEAVAATFGVSPLFYAPSREV